MIISFDNSYLIIFINEKVFARDSIIKNITGQINWICLSISKLSSMSCLVYT